MSDLERIAGLYEGYLALGGHEIHVIVRDHRRSVVLPRCLQAFAVEDLAGVGLHTAQDPTIPNHAQSSIVKDGRGDFRYATAEGPTHVRFRDIPRSTRPDRGQIGPATTD